MTPMAYSVRWLLETAFESRPGRIFVIEVVYTQCKVTVQRPGVCCAIYSTVHYKEGLRNKSRPSFCRAIALIVKKVT